MGWKLWDTYEWGNEKGDFRSTIDRSHGKEVLSKSDQILSKQGIFEHKGNHRGVNSSMESLDPDSVDLYETLYYMHKITWLDFHLAPASSYKICLALPRSVWGLLKILQFLINQYLEIVTDPKRCAGCSEPIDQFSRNQRGRGKKYNKVETEGLCISNFSEVIHRKMMLKMGMWSDVRCKMRMKLRKQRVDVDPRRSADRMSAACQQASPLPGPSIDRCTTQPLRLCGLLCVFGSTTSNHAVR